MGRKYRTQRTGLAALLLAALCLPAASPAGAQTSHQPSAASNGVLIYPEVVTELWVNSLDPAQVTDLQSTLVVNLVYSGLVKLDGKNQVAPDLAATLPTVSADHLTYTFTLRKDTAFSDGAPVTAEDVVYSISRSLSKQEKSPSSMLYLGHIKGAAAWNSGKASSLAGITALDAHTVRITLDRPIGYFLQSLSDAASYVVKRTVAAGEDLVGAGTQARNIGTGPFMFSKPWRYRQEMYLAPNPHWYNARRLKIQEIDVPFISNINVAYNEYLSGQIPVGAVPSPLLGAASHQSDFHSAPLLTIDYIAPNLGKDSLCKPVSCAPFNNLHFRRALLFAIDRRAITQKILHGSETPLCGLIPRGMAGYDDADLCKLTPYDPVRARAELALAVKDYHGALPNAGRLSAVYQALGQDNTSEYVELQSEWAAVGININIHSTPLDNWINLTAANYTPLLEDQWSADYADPQDYAENLLGAGSVYNVGNYDNPVFQQLITQADVTPNGPGRVSLYARAQQIALNDAAFMMIGQLVWSMRWKPVLHGFYISSSYTFQPLNQDWTSVSVG